METCIRNEFSVIDFIERLDDLDSKIESFNKYLAFDKIKIVRNSEVICFEYPDRIIIDEPTIVEASDDEKDFLSRVFSIDLDCTGLPADLKTVISGRMKEAEQCANNDAPLAATIMMRMKSPDLTQRNIEAVGALFPNCITETRGADGAIRRCPRWRRVSPSVWRSPGSSPGRATR